jgi:hypothetical protein
VLTDFTEARFAAGHLLCLNDETLMAAPFDPVKAVMLPGEPTIIAGSVAAAATKRAMRSRCPTPAFERCAGVVGAAVTAHLSRSRRPRAGNQRRWTTD